MGLNSGGGGGEIVQVQGGHIIRATGRKDRHSKVFTAKGPRDRRVRLSAHTAIQFYDVQDRLGYDRPSKAVDWLIKNAKASIDKLDELPPWDPIAANNNSSFDANVNVGCDEILNHVHHNNSSSDAYLSAHQGVVGSDTMKSFFPTNSEDNTTPMSFQNYPHSLISRVSNQNQDLCLSLHSFDQDLAGTSNHHQTGGGSSSHHPDQQTLFHQGSVGSLGFDAGSSEWTEQQHHHEMGRFTRLMGWANTIGNGNGNGGGEVEGRVGISYNQPHHHSLSLQQAILLNQQAYSQRGTLQSSNNNSVGSHQQQHHQQPSSISHGIGHGLSSDGLMGYCFPSQIHGHHHELGNSMSNRASLSSSLSPNSSTQH